MWWRHRFLRADPLAQALLNSSQMYESAKHTLAKHGVLVDNLRVDLGKMMAQKDQAVTGLTKGIEGLFKKNGLNVETSD